MGDGEHHGLASYLDLLTDGQRHTDAAWTYDDSVVGTLAHYVGFDWQAMDAWYEEDEQVFVHPRDPYHRVAA